MITNYKFLFAFLFVLAFQFNVDGGNPDRQGEAGAGELLFNPWARSAGLHGMNTSSIEGVESMRLNVAGLSRSSGTEVVFGHTELYDGSGVSLNAIGFTSKIGENGTFGISLNSVSFGELEVTTALLPEGTGSTISPNFFNIGLGYSYLYANKISVGILLRTVSESLPSVSAFGVGLDAGVQYVSGENDNFKLGIALRNIGAPMHFSGEGLSIEVNSPAPDGHIVTTSSRSADFDLPSLLNIGISYDFYFMDESFFRVLTNFTSNSFARDQLGIGGAFYYKNYLVLRGGYKKNLGEGLSGQDNLYTGFAGGFSVNIPLKRGSDKVLGFDYSYRTTDPFQGSHNIGLRISL